MRDIKFRAWDKSRLRMYQDPAISVDGVQWELDDYFSLNSVFLEGSHLDFMQFTGLKDKNGVEIYEGDILEQEVSWSNDEYYGDGESADLTYKGYASITASKGCVINKVLVRDNLEGNDEFKKLPHSVSVSGCRSEVIGNIHENPELL